MPAWQGGSYPGQPRRMVYFQDHSTRFSASYFSKPEKTCDTKLIIISPFWFWFGLGVCSLVWFFMLHKTTLCTQPYLPKSWITFHGGRLLPVSQRGDTAATRGAALTRPQIRHWSYIHRKGSFAPNLQQVRPPLGEGGKRAWVTLSQGAGIWIHTFPPHGASPGGGNGAGFQGCERGSHRGSTPRQPRAGRATPGLPGAEDTQLGLPQRHPCPHQGGARRRAAHGCCPPGCCRERGCFRRRRAAGALGLVASQGGGPGSATGALGRK